MEKLLVDLVKSSDSLVSTSEKDLVIVGGDHATTILVRATKKGLLKPSAITAVAPTWASPLPIVFGRDSNMESRYSNSRHHHVQLPFSSSLQPYVVVSSSGAAFLSQKTPVDSARGEAKLGLIYKDTLVERRLRTGDIYIYKVSVGYAFYIVNTLEGQRLHVICSIDPSEGLGIGSFQSFFIGGGSNPISVLAGFDPHTLSTALNVSIGELKDLMTSQEAGPFVYIDSHVPTFDSLKKEES